MKLIMDKTESTDSWSRAPQLFKFLNWAQLERLLNWLAGINTHTFSVGEMLISRAVASVVCC